MSNSLKKNNLFNGNNLTVNKLCHEQILDLKGALFPIELKKIKHLKFEMVFKISALK